jgi:hypothetical protein
MPASANVLVWSPAPPPVAASAWSSGAPHRAQNRASEGFWCPHRLQKTLGIAGTAPLWSRTHRGLTLSSTDRGLRLANLVEAKPQPQVEGETYGLRLRRSTGS